MSEMHVNLDDVAGTKEIDTGNMLQVVESFAEQLRTAAALAEQVPLGLNRAIEAIAVLGMGGSGISADFAREAIAGDSPLPFTCVKEYGLPASIEKNTLVFAVSYSGETEETLETYREATRRGCPVVAVTTGGTLEAESHEAGRPVVKIPAGLQPRAALGYLTIPILVVLGRLGLITKPTYDIAEALDVVARVTGDWCRNVPAKANQAKHLAMELFDLVPVIYGSVGITEVAALRWKSQFNENSKAPSFWNVLPELNHNETVGWLNLKDVSKRFALILLRDKDEHPRVSKRFEVTKELVGDYFAKVIEIETWGESRLARILSIILLGDFTSVYLALLYGTDPSPVERIQILKKRLGQDA